MDYLRFKSWEKYQGETKLIKGKVWEPPWFKVHHKILDDYEFGQLPDHSKFHVLGLMALACRTSNKIRADLGYLKYQLRTNLDVDIQGLCDLGFIEIINENGELETFQKDYGNIPERLRLEESRGDKRREEEIADASTLIADASLEEEREVEEEKKKKKEEDSLFDSLPSKPKFSVSDLIELWNEKAHPDLARVKEKTSNREKHGNARLKKYPDKKFWEDIIDQINGSSFLRGKNNRGWKADFDFMINESGLAKIQEGKYDGGVEVKNDTPVQEKKIDYRNLRKKPEESPSDDITPADFADLKNQLARIGTHDITSLT